MKNTTLWAAIISGVVVLLLAGGIFAMSFAGGRGPDTLPDGNQPTKVATTPTTDTAKTDTGAGAPVKVTTPPADNTPPKDVPLTHSATPPKNGKPMDPPVQADVDAAKAAGTQHAVIKTAKGEIDVDLYGADAPLNVANFIKLAKAKFYDGLTFHRVETNAGFQLIQGGDPNGDGSGGPGYEIKSEISPNLKHVEGALAMARSSDPNSAGSQFYICNCEITQLDGQYAVFGKVTKGLDVSKKIAIGDKIDSITIQ